MSIFFFLTYVGIVPITTEELYEKEQDIYLAEGSVSEPRMHCNEVGS
jgi:hypothetical protein